MNAPNNNTAAGGSSTWQSPSAAGVNAAATGKPAGSANRWSRIYQAAPAGRDPGAIVPFPNPNTGSTGAGTPPANSASSAAVPQNRNPAAIGTPTKKGKSNYIRGFDPFEIGGTMAVTPFTPLPHVPGQNKIPLDTSPEPVPPADAVGSPTDAMKNKATLPYEVPVGRVPTDAMKDKATLPYEIPVGRAPTDAMKDKATTNPKPPHKAPDQIPEKQGQSNGAPKGGNTPEGQDNAPGGGWGGSIPSGPPWPHRTQRVPDVGTVYAAGETSYQASQVESSPAPTQQPAAALVRIENPAKTRAAVAFMLDGEVIRLEPGQVGDFAVAGRGTVKFHRGAGFGMATYTLAEGAYHFSPTARGWELYQETIQDADHPPTNTLPEE